MKVLVMTAIAENELDLQVVMTARINGVKKVSPIMLKIGAADIRGGNPYLVYGDVVDDFIGSSKYDASIVVFDLRSGDLSGWDDPEEPIHTPLSIAALRRQLPVGATYSATWIGPKLPNPRTTRRRVVSQSTRIMQSVVLYGPESGRTIRLEWKGVKASEVLDVVTLDEDGPFLEIDTIGN